MSRGPLYALPQEGIERRRRCLRPGPAKVEKRFSKACYPTHHLVICSYSTPNRPQTRGPRITPWNIPFPLRRCPRSYGRQIN